MASVAKRLESILDFDRVAVTATSVRVGEVDLVVTRGTGEGCDFAYVADEVEDWLEGRESADYSEDFCGVGGPDAVVDPATARALRAIGYRIGVPGACTLVA